MPAPRRVPSPDTAERFLIAAHALGSWYTGKMIFDWDPNKAARNLQLHGVSFAEAATVFDDVLGWSFFDPDHSQDEDRFLTIGTSNVGRLLFVSYTESRDVLRIISARAVTRRERKDYESLHSSR